MRTGAEPLHQHRIIMKLRIPADQNSVKEPRPAGLILRGGFMLYVAVVFYLIV